MDTDTLKRRLRGTLITSFDPGFGADSDALIWNGRKPLRRARLIVRAASAADVQEAVRFAAAHGLTVSPRGGGHHFTGIAARADMVIDLGALDALQVDAAAQTARVEPSVTNARMAAALDAQGLAFPLGHCGSVPMSGYLLGGGVGWNGGAWGFACGRVTAVEIVLADGRLVTATATENADLFWAARGAGPGFFGIVTAYHLRLAPAAGAIRTVIRVYPPAAVDAVSAWAEAVMAKAPASVEFTAKIAGTPGGPVVAAIATVFAADETEASSIHDALSDGAPEALQVIGPLAMPFPALYEATDPSVPVGRRYRVESVWSDATLGTLLGRAVQGMALAPSTESFAVITLRPRAAPLPEGAALSRDGRIFGVVYGIWTEAEDDDRNAAWLHGLIDGLAPHCTGSYAGLADLDRPGPRLPTHAPDAALRLAALRARFDPAGLFGGGRAAAPIAAE
ncbi:FAD-binding oxidoreductase [Roseicyclus persicicus]|uniref:FAD-binding oxidoreductase n=1 Tax=Roseicyclus persicicus TaxID=2650661 RepID=A0A7X6H0H4_9RHOB|nr:FAD-binding oxidoreductase [Roseibacterium persicicum]NKX44636.1 FAD-binding oxidoreductase [Roseibacterium persicicum]